MSARLLRVLLALIALLIATPSAAQPEDVPRPAPKADPKLPPGHPPVDPAAQERMRERLKELVKQQRAEAKAKEAAGGAAVPTPTPVAPRKPKYPVDDHGYCIGQGPEDRPKDINLFHGWLGVDNEAAVKAPRQESAWDWEWWKWRLTPYPYRYENHEDHCDPRNQPIPLIANIINAGLLFFVLVRFGRKPVREALKKRREGVMKEIERAREIKRSARERRERYEDELENLDEKLDSLREQYALEGETEKKRAREDAADTRRRLLADADFRIAQESKSARNELSREALDNALRAAEALLEERANQADHDRLAEAYLDEIGPALEGDLFTHTETRA